MVKIIGNNNTILDQFIAELRDVEIQKDSLRFRRNLERIGEIFAYEISKHLPFESKEVQTSLGVANVPVLKAQPVLATILRAGLPLHQGFLNYYDHANNAFISAFRKYRKSGKFVIEIEYSSSPVLSGRHLILSDAMLATGSSVVLAYKELLNHGKPLHTHIVAALASAEGIEHLKKHLDPKDYTLWVGAVDDELTAQAYIVPGLGDAGDLAFGSKNDVILP